MKKAIICVVMTVLTSARGFAIDATPAELSASDLAAFLGVHHKTFTFKHDGSVDHITYTISIFKDGKVVASDASWDLRSAAEKKHQRYSVMYKEEGDHVDVTIVSNGGSFSTTIKKPKGVGKFSTSTVGTHFDAKGRMVLAFDVERDENGNKTITDQNSTPEGAKAALVLQIETSQVRPSFIGAGVLHQHEAASKPFKLLNHVKKLKSGN